MQSSRAMCMHGVYMQGESKPVVYLSRKYAYEIHLDNRDLSTDYFYDTSYLSQKHQS